MIKEKIKSRISILDGFRAIAIIAVMLFHFFSRWTSPISEVSLYPYSNQYNYFSYGNLGVNFFFIISGFVIFFTLEKTDYFWNFWKKRLIRLFPAMVVASVLTFLIFVIFDHKGLFPSSHVINNFLPSITFITPTLFNEFTWLFNTKFDYISASYWSLWPEVQFYLFSSFLFYLNKEKFIRNFIVVSLILIGINYLIMNIQNNNKLNITLPFGLLEGYTKWVQQIFNLISYLPFFSIGVLFYLLYKNKQLNITTSVFIKFSMGVFLFYLLYSCILYEMRFIYLGMILLFFAFIYFPEMLFVFEHKVLTSIGECSYFLYLIHENAGVLLIYSWGHYFLPLGFVFTLLVMILLITLSWLYTKKVDKKITAFLKNKFLPC